MAKTFRDFNSRPEAERQWMLENTWCESCNAADLGMTDPYEYEENGEIFVAGNCFRCGASVRSEVTGKNISTK